ncbi:MAG: glycosyltransferase [Methylovirgula sp.]
MSDPAQKSGFDWAAFFKGAGDHLVNAPWKLVFLAELIKRRLGEKTGNRTVVVSFYMANISKEVVAAQARAITRFLPEGVDLVQLHTGFGHGRSIDLFVALSSYDVIVLLDIDCVPISAEALPKLIEHARAGALVGAAQRANHIGNDNHLYAGPFLMAFSRESYRRLGSPSFRETRRGDVAEELTYRAEAQDFPIHYLWPTICEAPKWHLTGDITFGRNTVYEHAFLHAFEIRMPDQQKAFIAMIERVLGEERPPV